MTLPWEANGADDEALSAGHMTPDIIVPSVPTVPLSALDPATGQMVSVDVPTNLRDAIGEAIAGSMSNAAEMVTTRGEQVESAMAGGPITHRTLVQGLAVDLSLAAAAVVATSTSGTFDPFSKEAWVILGLLLVKTLVQTGISYATKVVIR